MQTALNLAPFRTDPFLLKSEDRPLFFSRIVACGPTVSGYILWIMKPKYTLDMEREIIENKILDVVADDSGLSIVILFGSASSGCMRAESDVDIAVLYDHALSAHEKESLTDRLSHRLGRIIDLVDLSVVNGVILRQVLCKGRILLKRSAPDYAALLERLVYNREDMMPYYRRTVQQRVERFAHG